MLQGFGFTSCFRFLRHALFDSGYTYICQSTEAWHGSTYFLRESGLSDPEPPSPSHNEVQPLARLDMHMSVPALGCHVHSAQPLRSASWNQKSLLDMTEKTLKAVVNGCAWGLRDAQGCLLNESWQILTTFPDVLRVLNHRPCDKQYKHGRLPDHLNALPLQFPQSLCQTFAQQFLKKDS